MSKQMQFIEGLSLAHQAQLESEPLYLQNRQTVLQLPSDPYWLTRDFHYAFDVEIPEKPVLSPSVSQRLQRLLFIHEEYMELLAASGFKLGFIETADPSDPAIYEGEGEKARLKEGWVYDPDADFCAKIGPVHIEASRYDPVETADALGDLNVVVNGMALELGIPMPHVNVEIFLSNMSKLGENGEPIKHECKYYGGDKGWMGLNPTDVPIPSDLALCRNRVDHNECDDDSHLIRTDLPRGKILKPDTYRKPNITRIIYDQLNEEKES